jgi:hypothetical protein
MYNRTRYNATLGHYSTLHSVRSHRAFESRRCAYALCVTYDVRARLITVFGSHRAFDVTV